MVAEQETVAAHDGLVDGIPHDELHEEIVVAGVEHVDVAVEAGAATRVAEADLAQTADLTHDVRRVVCRKNIDLIPRIVRLAEKLVFRQLFHDGRDRDWINNLIHMV